MTTSMVGSKQSVNGGDGRSKSKASHHELTQKKNRLPQRGTGMAQLERLRLQEFWKNMIQSSPNTPVAFQTPHTTGFPNFAAQFRPPHVQSPTPAKLFQMHGSNQFSSDHVMDPFGIRFENSRELSSIPSYITCASDECNVCHKKKRINGGNYNENMSMNQLTDARKTQRGSGQVTDQVMSVNRSGGSAVTEYDFFPGKGGGVGELSGSGTLDGGGKGLRGGEGSCVTAVGGSEEGGVSSLDLSLKLSY